MQNKPTMLYASPLPPVKSGISEYSERLLEELIKFYDITLYIDDYDIESRVIDNRFKVLTAGENEVDFDSYDYLVYNMGNNPSGHEYCYADAINHPGLVILHDLSIYFLYSSFHQHAKDLYSSIYDTFGPEYFKEIREDFSAANQVGSGADINLVSRYKFFDELVNSGNRIMVHSENSFLEIHAKYPEVNVRKIPMIRQMEESFHPMNRKTLLLMYGIPQDAVLVAAFGHIVDTKKNRLSCEVIKKLADKSQKIVYVMVGDGTECDDLVDNKVIFKLGYTELSVFNSFIYHSDIILNLRYPSMGETSAAVLRIMELGKTVIVNDDAWFSELPDTCVKKIPVSNMEYHLEKALQEMIENKEYRDSFGRNAKKYIEQEYSSDRIVSLFRGFLEGTDEKTEEKASSEKAGEYNSIFKQVACEKKDIEVDSPLDRWISYSVEDATASESIDSGFQWYFDFNEEIKTRIQKNISNHQDIKEYRKEIGAYNREDSSESDAVDLESLKGLSDEDFVYSLYEGLFNRLPDISGGTAFLAALLSGAKTRGQAIQDFQNSQEFKLKNVKVKGLEAYTEDDENYIQSAPQDIIDVSVSNFRTWLETKALEKKNQELEFRLSSMEQEIVELKQQSEPARKKIIKHTDRSSKLMPDEETVQKYIFADELKIFIMDGISDSKAFLRLIDAAALYENVYKRKIHIFVNDNLSGKYKDYLRLINDRAKLYKMDGVEYIGKYKDSKKLGAYITSDLLIKLGDNTFPRWEKEESLQDIYENVMGLPELILSRMADEIGMEKNHMTVPIDADAIAAALDYLQSYELQK